MKKRIASMILVATMVVSLAACGSATTSELANTETENEAETVAKSEPIETEAVEETQATEVTEATEVEEPEVTDPYTYTDLSKTMYAQSAVNVRDLPNTDGNKLGGLSTNQEVTVTGQCNETGWYRIDYNGSTAFVSNSYLGDAKVETGNSGGSSNSGGSGSASGNSGGGSTYDERYDDDAFRAWADSQTNGIGIGNFYYDAAADTCYYYCAINGYTDTRYGEPICADDFSAKAAEYGHPDKSGYKYIEKKFSDGGAWTIIFYCTDCHVIC